MKDSNVTTGRVKLGSVREWSVEQEDIMCRLCVETKGIQADHIRFGTRFQRKGRRSLGCRLIQDAADLASLKENGNVWYWIQAPISWFKKSNKDKEQAIRMWILLKTISYQEFEKMCREYGLTITPKLELS